VERKGTRVVTIAIPLACGAGLRLGESTGLTVDRVDFLHSIITIDRQLGLAPARVVRFTETKTEAAAPSTRR
jgi:hypothetical protein